MPADVCRKAFPGPLLVGWLRAYLSQYRVLMVIKELVADVGALGRAPSACTISCVRICI